MKRFVHRLRRTARWPEETHMAIAGAITIVAIFVVVFAVAKFGGPTSASAPVSVTRAK